MSMSKLGLRLGFIILIFIIIIQMLRGYIYLTLKKIIYPNLYSKTAICPT